MSGFTRPAPLCREEVEVSRRMHGSNLLSVKRKKSFFRQFLENLGDPVIRILLGALVINLLFLFDGIPGIVLYPVDILMILLSGMITYCIAHWIEADNSRKRMTM